MSDVKDGSGAGLPSMTLHGFCSQSTASCRAKQTSHMATPLGLGTNHETATSCSLQKVL